MRRMVIAALLASGALACGEDEDAPVTGACHVVAVGGCSGYPGGAPPGFSPAGCAAAGGVWVSACPVEGRLGTCVFETVPEPGGPTFAASTTWYPGLLATPDEAASSCASLEGEFTPGTAQAGPATEQSFSCDERSAEGTCSDYSGPWEPERQAAFEAICTMYGGTLLPAGASCSTQGRTGTCRVTHASTRVEDVRHYDPATAAADEAACSPFTWIAG